MAEISEWYKIIKKAVPPQKNYDPMYQKSLKSRKRKAWKKKENEKKEEEEGGK